MADLTDELHGPRRLFVRVRMRCVQAAWAFVMRCFREPA